MDTTAILQQADTVWKNRWYRCPYAQIEKQCVWEVLPDPPDLALILRAIETVLHPGKSSLAHQEAGIVLLQAYRSTPVTGTSPQMEAAVRLGFRVLNRITSDPPHREAA